MTARQWRLVLAALAVVVAGNVLLELVDEGTRPPSGPRSSSYATASHGLAAYASLLARNGHPVSRLREPPAGASLDSADTLVVLDPVGLTQEDGEAIAAFLAGGGRLVAGGRASSGWLSWITDEPEWSAEGADRAARRLAPVPELERVTEVRSAGDGSWSDAGESLPALGDEEATLLAVASPGDGRALLLADASPLHNRRLGEADNAAFALALAGDRGRRVVFAESVHGYGVSTGLAAVPDRWWWALGGLVLAALLYLVARGRRLGPPEREERDLPPPRREFVEAVGSLLARTKDAGNAGASVQAAARARLARRVGLAPDASDDDLRAAAARAKLQPDELAAVLEPVTDERQLLAAGRALARLRA
jgi:Domain of unknown function (DUF4350)